MRSPSPPQLSPLQPHSSSHAPTRPSTAVRPAADHVRPRTKHEAHMCRQVRLGALSMSPARVLNADGRGFPASSSRMATAHSAGGGRVGIDRQVVAAMAMDKIELRFDQALSRGRPTPPARMCRFRRVCRRISPVPGPNRVPDRWCPRCGTSSRPARYRGHHRGLPRCGQGR